MKKELMRKARIVKRLDTTGVGFGNFLDYGIAKSNAYLGGVRDRGIDLGRAIKDRDEAFGSSISRKIGK